MRAKKALSALGKVASIVIVALEVIIIFFLVISRIQGDVPSLFGYQMYFIQTGSMEPYLEIGDVIISKKYDGEELSAGKNGDVITYIGKTGEYKDKLITHRVSEIDGDNVIAQGDANNTQDPSITKDDVKAVMVYKTVVIDKLYKITSTVWGFLLLIVAPMIIIMVTEVISIVKEIKNGEKEADENEGSEEEQ